MKACPYRRDFYANLAADPEGGASVAGEQVDEELNKWLKGLDRIIAQIRKVYEENRYGKI